MAICKRRINRGGDNLAAAAGIAEASVVVVWQLWHIGGICGAAGAMVRKAVR